MSGNLAPDKFENITSWVDWCCPECGSGDGCWHWCWDLNISNQKCNKCNWIGTRNDLLSIEENINKIRFETLEKILNEEKINI